MCILPISTSVCRTLHDRLYFRKGATEKSPRLRATQRRHMGLHAQLLTSCEYRTKIGRRRRKSAICPHLTWDAVNWLRDRRAASYAVPPGSSQVQAIAGLRIGFSSLRQSHGCRSPGFTLPGLPARGPYGISVRYGPYRTESRVLGQQQSPARMNCAW